MIGKSGDDSLVRLKTISNLGSHATELSKLITKFIEREDSDQKTKNEFK